MRLNLIQINNLILDFFLNWAKVKEVNFSVFENFPYASIKLTDMLIMEKEPNINDTLLYAQQGYLQFNIFNLFSENQEISKVVLLNSKLNIKYDLDGNPNFKIFKEVKVFKPKSSRKDSKESFIICKNLR